MLLPIILAVVTIPANLPPPKPPLIIAVCDRDKSVKRRDFRIEGLRVSPLV